MSVSTRGNEPKMNRREFVKTAAAGAAGLALMGLPSGKSHAGEKYPHWGEAVVIRDEGATQGPMVNGKVAREMLDEAIKALTNGGGWQSLIPSYQPGEIVGIKVNAQLPKMATQPAVVAAIIHGLVGIGIPKDKIVIWDCEASAMMYTDMWSLMREFRGLRIATTDKLEDPFDQSKVFDIQGNPAHLSRLLT